MEINLKTHTIILMVGPSECGKTTFLEKQIPKLKEQYPKYRFSVVSSDQERRLLLGGEIEKHNPQMNTASKGAFKLLYKKLEELTSWPINHEVVFVDSNNLSKESRARFLEIANQNGYNIAAIVFKYNKRDDYFSHITGDKRIVIKHVEKFYKSTLATLNDISQKHFIRSKNGEVDISIEDYEQYTQNILLPRDYVCVGDIHGCYDLLNEVVQENNAQDKTTILVGDLVDKNTQENIEKTIGLVYQQMLKGNLLMVIGNHDWAVCSWLVQNNTYTKDIIEKYFESALYLDGENKERFMWIVENSHPFLLHEQGKFFVSHAPCLPKHRGKLRFQKEQRNWMYPKLDDFDNEIDWSKEVIKQIQDLERDEYNFPVHVFGHVALEKDLYGRSFAGIDTGACYNNYLLSVDFSKERRFYKRYGKSTNKDGLIKIIQDKESRVFDLGDFDARTRGRILHTAKEGIPVFSGTICPADKNDEELESLDWALDYFEEPIIQIKWMGSWSCIRLKQDATQCRTFSRNGYLVKKEGLEDAYQKLIDRLNWEGVEECIVGAELMPWRFLGDDLIDRSFYGLSWLTEQKLKVLKDSGFQEAYNKLLDFKVSGDKQEVIEKYGHHIWSTKTAFDLIKKENYYDLDKLDGANKEFRHQIDLYGKDCEPYFEPFLIYKIIHEDGKETIHAHDNTLVFDIKLNQSPYLAINKNDSDYRERAQNFFNSLTTELGHEGVVVKERCHKHNHKAPYIKVRNKEYLRLVYGYDYQESLEYHRNKKNISRKLKMSIEDWQRAMLLLDIPTKEISDKNKDAVNLVADFVVGEQRQQEIDPRL